MIPQSYITEWSNQVPWQTNEQVEQDLVISRALVEIFSDEFLSQNLAFRGGTALHKLYLQPQPRYSEDIDLVQITAAPFGMLADRIKRRLSFLGQPVRKQKENNFTLHYRFESEFPPVQHLRLKVETNSREHFSVLGYKPFPFHVSSSWFTGGCNITTFEVEELLGTKLRALYQRSKGRDLYDMYKAMELVPALAVEHVLMCYKKYMDFVVDRPPTRLVFLQNMEAKMQDKAFIGDLAGLIRPSEEYDHRLAYERIKRTFIDRLE